MSSVRDSMMSGKISLKTASGMHPTQCGKSACSSPEYSSYQSDVMRTLHQTPFTEFDLFVSAESKNASGMPEARIPAPIHSDSELMSQLSSSSRRTEVSSDKKSKARSLECDATAQPWHTTCKGPQYFQSLPDTKIAGSQPSFRMSRVDWRWAANKGFWDKDKKCWIESNGGQAAYLEQRSKRTMMRQVRSARRARAPDAVLPQGSLKGFRSGIAETPPDDPEPTTASFNAWPSHMPGLSGLQASTTPSFSADFDSAWRPTPDNYNAQGFDYSTRHGIGAQSEPANFPPSQSSCKTKDSAMIHASASMREQHTSKTTAIGTMPSDWDSAQQPPTYLRDSSFPEGPNMWPVSAPHWAAGGLPAISDQHFNAAPPSISCGQGFDKPAVASAALSDRNAAHAAWSSGGSGAAISATAPPCESTKPDRFPYAPSTDTRSDWAAAGALRDSHHFHSSAVRRDTKPATASVAAPPSECPPAFRHGARSGMFDSAAASLPPGRFHSEPAQRPAAWDPPASSIGSVAAAGQPSYHLAGYGNGGSFDRVQGHTRPLPSYCQGQGDSDSVGQGNLNTAGFEMPPPAGGEYAAWRFDRGGGGGVNGGGASSGRQAMSGSILGGGSVSSMSLSNLNYEW